MTLSFRQRLVRSTLRDPPGGGTGSNRTLTTWMYSNAQITHVTPSMVHIDFMEENMGMNVPLLTHQVANILGVSKVRVHQLCKEGMLSPARDEDGTRLFDLVDVEELARRRAAVVSARSALRRHAE